MPEIQVGECDMCICHEDGTRHPDDPEGKVRSTWAWTPSWYTGPYSTTQGHCNHNGDGACDDSNNIPECNYDEGWWYLMHYLCMNQLAKQIGCFLT